MIPGAPIRFLSLSERIRRFARTLKGQQRGLLTQRKSVAARCRAEHAIRSIRCRAASIFEPGASRSWPLRPQREDSAKPSIASTRVQIRRTRFRRPYELPTSRRVSEDLTRDRASGGGRPVPPGYPSAGHGSRSTGIPFLGSVRARTMRPIVHPVRRPRLTVSCGRGSAPGLRRSCALPRRGRTRGAQL